MKLTQSVLQEKVEMYSSEFRMQDRRSIIEQHRTDVKNSNLQQISLSDLKEDLIKMLSQFDLENDEFDLEPMIQQFRMIIANSIENSYEKQDVISELVRNEKLVLIIIMVEESIKSTPAQKYSNIQFARVITEGKPNANDFLINEAKYHEFLLRAFNRAFQSGDIFYIQEVFLAFGNLIQFRKDIRNLLLDNQILDYILLIVLNHQQPFQVILGELGLIKACTEFLNQLLRDEIIGCKVEAQKYLNIIFVLLQLFSKYNLYEDEGYLLDSAWTIVWVLNQLLEQNNCSLNDPTLTQLIRSDQFISFVRIIFKNQNISIYMASLKILERMLWGLNNQEFVGQIRPELSWILNETKKNSYKLVKIDMSNILGQIASTCSSEQEFLLIKSYFPFFDSQFCEKENAKYSVIQCLYNLFQNDSFQKQLADEDVEYILLKILEYLPLYDILTEDKLMMTLQLLFDILENSTQLRMVVNSSQIEILTIHDSANVSAVASMIMNLLEESEMELEI